MNVHKSARLTPRGRAELVARVVEKRQSLRAVTDAFGVTIKTVSKWVGRFEADGRSGLATVPHGRIGSIDPRRPKRPKGLSPCAASASPVSGSPGRAGTRRPR